MTKKVGRVIDLPVSNVTAKMKILFEFNKGGKKNDDIHKDAGSEGSVEEAGKD